MPVIKKKKLFRPTLIKVSRFKSKTKVIYVDIEQSELKYPGGFRIHVGCLETYIISEKEVLSRL